MSWLIPASAALLIFAILVVARLVSRRRRSDRIESSAAPTPPRDSAAYRVRQFINTGSHRLVEPTSAATDLRYQTQTMLAEAELASDLATLDLLLADIRDALGADEAIFWRWSAEKDALAPNCWSTSGPRPLHFDMRAWGGLVKWSAEARMVNFDADARVAVTRLASAPIELDGRLIGVLSVARAEGLERGREHLKSWLPRHAAQVGRLVQLFELRSEYGRYMRQGQALLTAAQHVQSHKSQEALCKAICETALQVSSASDAALIRWRADAERGWVQFTTSGFHHRAPFPLTPDALASVTCREGTLLLLDDTSTMDPSTSLFFDGDGGWPRGTLAIVPLKLEERVMGAIVVASSVPDALPREEARNVQLLGALAANSLEMVWEMEEVSRRARTDALTGLANRRAFDEQLETLLAQSDRFGHQVSLILADVDNFKSVNDTWGHEVGDIVLQSIAKTLSDGVRAVDVCSRFGGEEIAILLPQTSLQGAVELADRLRKAVEAKPIHAQGNEISVTVSCGVSCYPDGVLTKEALFAAADRALYEAKSAGRNCVKAAVPKPIGVVR
jgi:diguanylate cyclase (GGDEF)-like protein